MAKRIVYIGFKNQQEGENWRRLDVETNFLIENVDLTDAINEVRERKPIDGSPASDFIQYYEDLHEKKSIRQLKWAKYLMNKTAEKLAQQIHEIGPIEEDVTFVAVLPEFYWRDINDNSKHEADMTNYGKPFYLESVAYLLDVEPSNLKKPKSAGYMDGFTLRNLTEIHKNLIIFAGTVWWKEINPTDHKDEKILNTLPVFKDGKCDFLWTKRFASTIDGLNGLNRTIVDKTNKKIAYPDIYAPYGEDLPLLEFRGIKFSVDICLDFIYTGTSLSKQILSGINIIPDVHVLVAGGMPVDVNNRNNIYCNSLFLRCDLFDFSTTHGVENQCVSGYSVVSGVNLEPVNAYVDLFLIDSAEIF